MGLGVAGGVIGQPELAVVMQVGVGGQLLLDLEKWTELRRLGQSLSHPLHEAPPVGEEIHLPGPSVIPLVTAIGITLTVIGTTISWYISGLGVIIVVLTVIRWIRDPRRDVGQLPESHPH